MKNLISVAFGAAALATAAFAVATPAQARDNFGVYVGPGGAAISVDYYRGCSNYWYRRNHPYVCGYGRYNERYYYPYYNYRHYRYHHYDRHRRDRDRDDRRWRHY